ncbi:hypothetical protein H6F46_07675 [Limnothrix sp. FACHB-1083]|uniref:hypothetical protein n=1 Tax=unclassified Limnothrix TaxID=2632864 RepID=UPI001680A638|nr:MULTISPECIES: hypothetical protein [unclassified Limnothrix]MBD2160570.1 hypothetical protein [Limnothrix sp. FACHB-1083]MBD2191272.1 hypothetical protein [Limnothrix sp. FACHB-1088]
MAKQRCDILLGFCGCWRDHGAPLGAGIAELPSDILADHASAGLIVLRRVSRKQKNLDDLLEALALLGDLSPTMNCDRRRTNT